jgi:hypothetical protein
VVVDDATYSAVTIIGSSQKRKLEKYFSTENSAAEPPPKLGKLRAKLVLSQVEGTQRRQVKNQFPTFVYYAFFAANSPIPNPIVVDTARRFHVLS